MHILSLSEARLWRQAAMIASVLALIEGCAEYAPAPISAATQAETLDRRTLDDARMRQFIDAASGPNAAASQSWDLGKLTLAALYYHPELELARSDLQTARAAAITAGQYPNPTASVAITAAPWTISPAIDFLIETFGAREYRTAQAQALIEAAREDLATASWQVRGQVRAALLNLWAASQRAALLEARLSLQDQLVQLLERRLQEGEASALDVARERVNRNQASVAVREAQRQAADARAQLATAIGIPVSGFDGVTFSVDVFDRTELPAATIAADARFAALTRRTDVQALLAEYRAAEAAVQLEFARQYPNVTLGPGLMFEQSEDRYEFTVSAAAELPVFNRNEGPIAEAEARRRTAAARLTALQAQIIGAIDTAVANYGAATVTLETADALVADAGERNDRIMRSFQAGDIDRPTLVTAGIELAIAELARFEAYIQQRMSIGALEDALQRQLYEPDAPFVIPETDPLTSTEPTP